MTEAFRLNLRLATADDIPKVAGIIEEVSEGIVGTLFEGVMPMMTARDILELVIGKNQPPYSADNMVIADVNGEIGGLLFAYPATHQKVSPLMETFLSKNRIDEVRALLTAGEPRDFWVNTLWISPALRGEGLANVLINCAKQMALDRGAASLALHCWLDNRRALAFYEKCGFSQVGTIAYGDRLSARHPEGGALLRLSL